MRTDSAPASAALRVDFVSDITCPWCAIGLEGLLQAIARLGDEVPVELHLQPFELNPDIADEGEPIADYAARKYGASPAQLAQRQSLIRGRAAELGLDFRERTHVYNTFDAHRLLHWSVPRGRALDVKRALLRAYHERGENPASPGVLLAAAQEAGLDRLEAGDMLGRGTFGREVRTIVRQWQRLGISGVPTTVIDGRPALEGGQAPAVFEAALRDAAQRRRRPQAG